MTSPCQARAAYAATLCRGLQQASGGWLRCSFKWTSDVAKRHVPFAVCARRKIDGAPIALDPSERALTHLSEVCDLTYVDMLALATSRQVTNRYTLTLREGFFLVISRASHELVRPACARA
jgi:hypothetical protein